MLAACLECLLDTVVLTQKFVVQSLRLASHMSYMTSLS